MIHVRRVALFAALSVSNLLIIWSPDVLPGSLFAWSVVREGDVDYDEFTFLDRESYFFRACGESTATEPPSAARSPGGPPAPGPADRVCSIFPPGAAVLALPFFAPLALAGARPDDLPLLLTVGKIVAALEEAIATALLVATAATVATPRWALAVGLLYLLGTGVRTISSQALWQHGAAHLLLALALWLLVREHLGTPIAARGRFLAGLALGFAVVVRQTSVVFALAALAAQLSTRRPLAALAAGVALGALPLPLYDLAAFGDPFAQGYGAKSFTTRFLEGAYGLLASPSRGLFIYSPFLLFAIPPLVRSWWRGNGVRAAPPRAPVGTGPGSASAGTTTTTGPAAASQPGLRGDEDAAGSETESEVGGGRPGRPRRRVTGERVSAAPPGGGEDLAPLFRAFGVAGLLLFVVYASYSEWWGGRVFGARFLSDAFPVLAIALAAAPPRRTLARSLFALAAAWSLLLHNAAAFVYDQRWDTTPNVNFEPARLFAWADPQWLAVLTQLASPAPRVLVAAALTGALLAALVYAERRALGAPALGSTAT